MNVFRAGLSKLRQRPRVDTDMGASPAPDLDAQLMLRVRDGDEDSFRVLLDKYRNPLIHFLYRMVQHQPVSEELAQEVFLRIYRSRASYEPTARFTTYMFRIATHLALNWLRDEKPDRVVERLDQERDADAPVWELPDRNPSVEQRMVYQSRLQEIRDAISMLPEKQRAAVLMHKYQEMEYAQIAVVLECSESAVKSTLFRAYETLRLRLAHLVSRGTK
jgi:RNA polymerase sigma-70 factor (ECF subfamily)